MNRILNSGDSVNLKVLIEQIARELELEEHIELNEYAELLRVATEGDERFIEILPDVSRESDLGLEAAVMPELRKAIADRQNLEEYGKISAEVRKELRRNESIDIFASILEMIYNILITKTIYFATDLGIGTFYLDDKSGNARLHEKMASELSKMDIELQFHN